MFPLPFLPSPIAFKGDYKHGTVRDLNGNTYTYSSGDENWVLRALNELQEKNPKALLDLARYARRQIHSFPSKRELKAARKVGLIENRTTAFTEPVYKSLVRICTNLDGDTVTIRPPRIGADYAEPPGTSSELD